MKKYLLFLNTIILGISIMLYIPTYATVATPYRIAVIEYNGKDDFINAVVNNLKIIEGANSESVKFEYFDSENNANKQANVLYEVGLNLIMGRPALYNTAFTFDNSGVAIRVPITDYLVE